MADPIIPNEFGDYDYWIYNFPYHDDFTDKIYTTKSPEYLYKKVLNEIERQNSIEEVSSAAKLAGDIKKETQFSLDKCDVQLRNEFLNFVDKQILQIKNNFQKYEEMEGWNMISTWVNYQKAGEYNPFHSHDGDLSFVWYLNIPEEIRQEHLNQKHTPSKTRGLIQFHSQRTTDARTFNPETGDFLLFGAELPHAVYPFYTKDVTRISMSGNIEIVY